MAHPSAGRQPAFPKQIVIFCVDRELYATSENLRAFRNAHLLIQSELWKNLRDFEQETVHSIALILKINTGSLKAYQLDGSFVSDFKFVQPTPSL